MTNAFSDSGSCGMGCWVVDSNTGFMDFRGIAAAGNYYQTSVVVEGVNFYDCRDWEPEGFLREIRGYVYAEARGFEWDSHCSIWLYDAETGSAVDSTYAQLEGYFDFRYLDPGRYFIRINKDGHLQRVINDILVENEVVTIATQDNPIVVWAGDVQYNSAVDVEDLARMIAYLGYPQDDDFYNRYHNFDNMNGIDMRDISILIKNIGLTRDDYPEWTW